LAASRRASFMKVRSRSDIVGAKSQKLLVKGK
jgi:hypothetical protein